MKRKIFMAVIYTTAVSLIFVSGCKKVLDYIVARPGGIAKDCRIERITSNFSFECDDPVELLDTAWFSYNRYGNPVSIKYAVSPQISACFVYPPDQAFKYDHKNRLVVYLQGAVPSADEPSGALLWHKYTYVNTNLIIDSAFEYAQGDLKTSNRPTFFEEAGTTVTTFELDQFGRVIKEVGGPHNVNITYTYDGHGNLVKPGVTYTGKINMRQTNGVWMFLDRDYSVNSPVGAASAYNASGLPVKLNETPYFIYWFSGGFSDMVVSYHCKKY